MIVPMKKAYIVALRSNMAGTLASLADIGLLHVETHAMERSSALEKYERRVEEFSSVLQIIGSEYSDADTLEEPFLYDAAKDECRKILEAKERLYALEQLESDLSYSLNQVTPWGNINPEDMKALKRDGIFTNLLSWQGKEVPDLDPQGILEKSTCSGVMELFSAGGYKYGVVFSLQDIEIPSVFQIVELEKGVKTLQAEIAKVHEEKTQCLDLIRQGAMRRGLLEKGLKVTEDKLHFEEARCSLTDTGEEVVYISGYIPAEQTEALTHLAQSNSFGVILDEPGDDDPVPTKLKYNKFSRLMQPLYGILGITPGYREMDISTLFLLFFAIFVGILIGDAGYGLLMGVGTLFLWKKTKQLSSGVLLLGLLSVVITTWGVVTGNWFGMEALAQTTFVKTLTIPSIAAFPEVFGLSSSSSQDSIIQISFLLGTIQLSIANGLNVYRERKSLRAFAHVGWGIFTIAIYRLALNLILDRVFPTWGVWALAAGAILVLLFGAQEDGKSFFYGLKQGLKGGFFQFLDMVGVFSNIVSYIRLFAVGLSSVAIAISFNSLGADLMGSFVGLVFGVVIVVFGHSLNFAMGLLSMLVHGARLNLLEFSGQLKIEWSGIPYKPLEKQYKE